MRSSALKPCWGVPGDPGFFAFLFFWCVPTCAARVGKNLGGDEAKITPVPASWADQTPSSSPEPAALTLLIAP